MFAKDYFLRTAQVLELMVSGTVADEIDELALLLKELKTNKGRLFILGVGGSAANASHGVGDLRKLANIEAYTPTDNVYELTARTNDEGWESVFREWLKVSKLTDKDVLLILSVGGGDVRRQLSLNLVAAANYGKEVGAKVYAILGITGGELIKISDKSILIPKPSRDFTTPVTETIQSSILHLLAFHHHLRENASTW